MVWQVAVPGVHTVTVTNAPFTYLPVGPASIVMGSALATPSETLTIVEPDFVESCCEVAVMVKAPAVVLLNTPVIGLILPLLPGGPLCDQFTLGLKAPVPMTVAEHEVNCPAWTDDGAHVAFTDV